jgi:transposase
MLEEGLTPSKVADRLGVSVRSVRRWREAREEGGDGALSAKPVPGRPKKLGETECERLWSILLDGALAYGFPNELWTLRRIAGVIRREFAVHYHPSHVWKILRRAKWSCQVPERRAIQRNEEKVARWKRYKWPAIKKSRKTWCPPRIP